jgi:urea transport system permease protein
MRAPTRNRGWFLAALFAFVALAWVGRSRPAWADDAIASDIDHLGSTDPVALRDAVEHLAKAGDARALPALQALDDGKLKMDTAGHAFIDDGSVKSAVPGANRTPVGALTAVEVDNSMRRELGPALAALRLSAPDKDIRLAAAQELAGHPSDDATVLLRTAEKNEKDPDVHAEIVLALAQVDLASDDVNRRLAAVSALQQSGDVSFKGDMERLTTKDAQGEFNEPDLRVRQAAAATLKAIENKIALISVVGNLFYGISLGSVLLLAALGLAITFGLMRVINMAHGEMLMLGAYATFSVQNFFAAHFPNHMNWYLVAAVPVAFLVSFGVGVLLERTVIQRLYGRPLETLLATWGISLILIQTVREIYGAQNVAVANPDWLSGGWQLLPGVVLTYSRLVVIVFSAAVLLFTWFVMNRTKLGLELRAVVQNREMAAAIGIATRRVDMWTFGIGSGIAGLGGVALSQLGNVGPELGQNYIVDSFMVVVLGGVGKMAGTVVGAMGLGIANKFLEPFAGAVLGKIFILGFIILFVQKRPQGLFALKGRFAEVG